MKKGWIWVALLLSVGVNIGVLATLGITRAKMKAQWERPRDGDRMPPFERVARHLGLEGEGREQFMEIQRGLFRQTLRNREALHELRAELRQELMSEDPDPERIETLLVEIGAAHGQLDRDLAESVLATREILSPRQQQRYFRIVERMREATRRAGQWGGPRRPDRRPPPADRP